MKHCPVCNTKIENLYTGLCPNQECTWEFEFVGAEPTPEMQMRYKEKLRLARAVYERVKQTPQDADKNEKPTVPEGDYFSDPRDGEIYKTITIEDPLKGTKVIWLAENMRFKTENSWVYDNDEGFVKTLGRLYTWDAAKQACHPGWRLPSNRDWDLLVETFGGMSEAGNGLKSTNGWNKNGNGDNRSGFTALPGGARDFNGAFSFIGDDGYWWSATEYGTGSAWTRSMYYDSSTLRRSVYGKELGFSVRCLRDF